MSPYVAAFYVAMGTLAGYQLRGAVPSKHATFIERRINPRNDAIWTHETRERYRRPMNDIDMAAAGAPWKEQV